MVLSLTRRINKIDPSLSILAFAADRLSDEFLESGALACLKTLSVSLKFKFFPRQFLVIPVLPFRPTERFYAIPRLLIDTNLDQGLCL